ncbi:hypothetical protein [Bacillus sp. EB600]|uniref:hypothetical protein n=1 Tax=Bacillus sp. EB600 TaxID=2806345 RepID=UPI00210CCABD|nr:hypothetical protein [Bacillus sp. EB600]MCQ6279509.1 hypothetical protein [Bacillus sp. EB600]
MSLKRRGLLLELKTKLRLFPVLVQGLEKKLLSVLVMKGQRYYVNLIPFFASEEADFVPGQVWKVDGGWGSQ